jgi:hypothetical protein
MWGRRAPTDPGRPPLSGKLHIELDAAASLGTTCVAPSAPPTATASWRTLCGLLHSPDRGSGDLEVGSRDREEEAGEGEVDAASAMPGGRRPRLRLSGSTAAGRRKASGRTERAPRPRPSPPPPSSGERRRGGRRATAELCLLLYRAGKSRTSPPSLTLCSPCWEAARHAAPPRTRSTGRGRGLRQEGIRRRGRGGGAPPACEENAARTREKRRWLD